MLMSPGLFSSLVGLLCTILPIACFGLSTRDWPGHSRLQSERQIDLLAMPVTVPDGPIVIPGVVSLVT
jgi:hypothetical protein